MSREAPERVTGLERTLASLPVYRTYVEPWSGRVADEDREAVREARLPASLASRLLLEVPGWEAFVTRFQQTTPPVMAKGVEDTAFYRYARLLAANDVGGDPGRWSVSVEQFHRANAERLERFPLNLLVTQTHDTKRSGDVRARIGALSAMPDEFAAHVRQWLSVCRSLTSGGAPTPVEQLFIFQTLLGVWPISEQRLYGYLQKAMREAKQHTSWVDVNAVHEASVQSFARALLTHRDFLRTFEPFQREVAAAGDRASLGQLLLKLTVPGRARHLPGRRAALPVAGRPRQPPRRRLGRASRRAGRSAAEAAGDPEGAGAAQAAAGGVPGAYEPVEAGPDTVAFTRGGGAVFVAVRLRGAEELPRPAGEWTVELELDGLLLLSAS